MESTLDEKSLKSVYDKLIRVERFTPVASNTGTQKTFLGGQPGSGKSYLNEIAIGETPLKEAVVIVEFLNQHIQRLVFEENVTL